MNQRPMRRTKQKEVILSVLQSTESHPTADWIYEEARKQLPDLSLGTVYRNLHVLKEMGLIQELNYGSTSSRFDGNPYEHYHFVCLQCGLVKDIDAPIDKEMDRQVEKDLGSLVEYHRLEFYGTCAQCKEGNQKHGLS